MSHAVHLGVDSYDPRLREKQPEWWVRSVGDLHDVLEVMLAQRGESRWNSTYPVNCPTLT